MSKPKLIENYVMSGKNWTSFYQISGDRMRSFDVIVYDDEQAEDGAYEKNYQQALQKVVQQAKN